MLRGDANQKSPPLARPGVLEVIPHLRHLLRRFGYRGAVWDCGLVQDGGRVGLPFVEVTLIRRTVRPGTRTLLSVPNFRMVRMHTDVNHVRRFIDYIVRIERVFGSTLPADKEPGFRLGSFVVRCFGNFMSRRPELVPSHRSDARTIDGCWSRFVAEYAIHESATLVLPYDLRLVAHTPPFGDVSEAYAHYFHMTGKGETNHRIRLVLPVVRARIETARVDGTILSVAVERASPMVRGLRLSVLAHASGDKDYRRQSQAPRRNATYDLGFEPDSYEVVLLSGPLEIDRYEWHRPISHVPTSAPLSFGGETVEPFSQKLVGQLSEPIFFPKVLVVEQAPAVQRCLQEAEGCARAELWVAAAVMLRKALDLSVRDAMRALGREPELYADRGREKTLSERLQLLGQSKPAIQRQRGDLLDIKWFGDKGAHSAMEIVKDDIDRIVPKLRAFLTELASPSSSA